MFSTLNEWSYDSNKKKCDLFQESWPNLLQCMSDSFHNLTKTRIQRYQDT